MTVYAVVADPHIRFKKIQGAPLRYWVYARVHYSHYPPVRVSRRIGVVHRSVDGRKWFAESDDGMLLQSYASRRDAALALRGTLPSLVYGAAS